MTLEFGRFRTVYVSKGPLWPGTVFTVISEASRLVTSAHGFLNGRDAEYGDALAMAIACDPSRAQRTVGELTKRFPEDSLVKFSYLPTLRAVVALHHREPSKAIGLLQAANAYELGYQGANSVGFAGSLYAIYVRGKAHLKARHGSEAAAEFQEILDHRGIAFAEPIGVVARLQLGRAFLLAGDTSKARAAYQDFLALWNDADPDIPIPQSSQSRIREVAVIGGCLAAPAVVGFRNLKT